MEQIPEIQKESLEQFDSKLLNVTLQKVTDKRRKDHFKRLIAGCIGVGHGINEEGNSYVFRKLPGSLAPGSGSQLIFFQLVSPGN